MIMEQKNYTGIIPRHFSGKQISAESDEMFETLGESRKFYKTVKKRLMDVNNWNKLAGNLSARFQLVSADGEKVDRTVEKGDYFRIDIPGPGPEAGEGNDWVRVEEIKEVSQAEVESIGIRVRPSQKPRSEEKDIAHFYSNMATSNFIVTREGKKVSAAVYDINTKTNEHTSDTIDKIRDKIIGAGALAIFSKLQWKALTEGLISKNDSDS
jgi:hypothetical protein